MRSQTMPNSKPDRDQAHDDEGAHQRKQHVEDLLDQGIEESFPASDPLSIAMPQEWKRSE